MAGGRHRFSVVSLTVVAASLLFANLIGFKSDQLPDGSRLVFHGWPTIYLERWGSHYDTTSNQVIEASRWPIRDQTDPAIRFPRLLVNVFSSMIILVCTLFVLTTRQGTLRPPIQLGLRQLIIAMAILAAMFALTRTGPVYWYPLVTLKPLVFFPILLGLMCVAISLERALVRLAAKSRGRT